MEKIIMTTDDNSLRCLTD